MTFLPSAFRAAGIAERRLSLGGRQAEVFL
jgi:hypothetical protein